MTHVFSGCRLLLLTAAVGALTSSAFADAPIESDPYGVKIVGMKSSDDEEPIRRGGSLKVEDCFSFYSNGDFFSSVLGSGGWESKDVLFLEILTVSIEGYDDEGDTTLTLLRIGDNLFGIGRNSEFKLKTYLISGKADDCEER
jgi:hypothetical protein